MAIYLTVCGAVLLVGILCAIWLGTTFRSSGDSPVVSPVVLTGVFVLLSGMAVGAGYDQLNDQNRGPAGTAYDYTQYTGVIAGFDSDRNSRSVFTDSGYEVSVSSTAVTPLGQSIEFSCDKRGFCVAADMIVDCARPCASASGRLLPVWIGALALTLALPYAIFWWPNKYRLRRRR